MPSPMIAFPNFSRYHLRFFQYQVSLQCEIFLDSSDLLTAALAEPESFQKSVKAWSAIQGMLTASANISKALWGKDTPVRQALRKSIGIVEPSILQEKQMRNAFEHFDERIDDWWDKSEHHNVTELNIGKESDVTAGFDKTDIFRNFDPTSGDLILLGVRLNLYAVRDEIAKIAPIVRGEIAKPLSPFSPWDP